MANLSNQPYKGTRDYYPDDKRLQNYIFGVWRRVAERFGYEEYAAPILEPLELYAAKTGQEIVNEQTYQFVDRGGRSVAIRPEMTPSIARMVAARQQELGYPARLYSVANFMRYERPQKGREREFWQLNLDLFGVDGVEADAEIIIVSDQIMREFGARDDMYTIRINNRRLINFMMADYLELDGADALAMIKLFDRKDKMNGEQFMNQAAEIFDGQSADEGLKKIQRLVSANSMADLPEDIRDSEAVEEVRELFSRLKEAGVTNAKFDITLMRGFDYYTGMVFEVFDNSPDNNRAMFGGGRYDGLVGLFGGDNVPTVGVAPGATTTEEFLKAHQLLPELQSTTDAVIIVIGDNLKSAQKLAGSLRASGVNVSVDLTNRKTDKQIKSVVKMQVPYMIFVGDHEVAESKYRLKDVSDQTETSLAIGDIAAAIKQA
ncbi:MAG TPA: histidine--tRNA ligase [Candidatus Saccharimonadales bacterium]|nr:histidine--tRNA ligase [Candidatus Saccharimonadales bacterium]